MVTIQKVTHIPAVFFRGSSLSFLAIIILRKHSHFQYFILLLIGNILDMKRNKLSTEAVFRNLQNFYFIINLIFPNLHHISFMDFPRGFHRLPTDGNSIFFDFICCDASCFIKTNTPQKFVYTHTLFYYSEKICLKTSKDFGILNSGK